VVQVARTAATRRQSHTACTAGRERRLVRHRSPDWTQYVRRLGETRRQPCSYHGTGVALPNFS
jgi:hypothetical protein